MATVDLVIALAAGDVQLHIERRSPGNWVQVVVYSGTTRVELGSEDLEWVVRHILSFLESNSRALECIMCLAEVHGCIYGAFKEDGTIECTVMDGGAREALRFSITAAERLEWVSKLRAG